MQKIKLLRPVDVKFAITSPFGATREIEKGIKQVHHGIDFGCPVGTPVYAMGDGYIFKRGWENEYDHKQGLGFRIWSWITINGEEFDVWYGHMSEIYPVKHDRIKKGQKIGLSGNTGHSTGPHLHVQFKDPYGDWCDAEFEGGIYAK